MKCFGFGKNVPPEKEQVIIYFLEKGKSEKQASDFFDLYTYKRWKNPKGKLIKNWKVHAWEYIWSGK